jgi:Na+-driven multidrug efflux pump
MFYGAKRYDLLKSMVRYTTLWSIIISIFFSISSFFYIDNIAPFFLTATTPDEIEMSKKAILSTINYYRVMVFIYPFIAITMVSTRAMQAIGKAWPMMVVSFSRVILFQCTLSYIFITILDKEIMWAWYAIGISCSLSAIIAYLMRVYFYKKISYIN